MDGTCKGIFSKGIVFLKGNCACVVYFEGWVERAGVEDKSKRNLQQKQVSVRVCQSSACTSNCQSHSSMVCLIKT